MIRVRHITNSAVAITVPGDDVDVEVLVSYETPVAVCIGWKRFITSTFYSNTTSRHIQAWLDGAEGTKVSQALINETVNAIRYTG